MVNAITITDKMPLMTTGNLVRVSLTCRTYHPRVVFSSLHITLYGGLGVLVFKKPMPSNFKYYINNYKYYLNDKTG